MQPLKTNLLYKLNTSGFLFLLALLLISLNFLIVYIKFDFISLIYLSIIIYIFVLLLKKYKLQTMTFLVVLVSVANLINTKNDQKSNITLAYPITIYPDQIKVKDDWFTGQGKSKSKKILIAGKMIPKLKLAINKNKKIILYNLSGEITEIAPATNYGEFDFKRYYQSRNIDEQIKLTNYDVLMQNNSIVHKIRYQLQRYFSTMPKKLSFFSSELILAENNKADNDETLSNYRDLGIIHVLAISGLHVSLYTMIISFICSFLKFDERQALLISGLILLVGVLLSQFQPGFVRASFTYILGQSFKIKNYKIQKYDLLGLTAIIHMLFDPLLFLKTGAILSYVLSLSLLMTEKMPKLKQAIMVNFSITPFLLTYFYQLNMLTIILNVIIVPYFNWLVLPCTFFNLICAKIIPNLTGIFEACLNIGESIINMLAKTNLGVIAYGKITSWQCLTLYVITSYLIIIDPKLLKTKNKFYTIALMYGLIFITIHYPLTGQVTFIDVGQGDSILITTPVFRKVYLIDTGGKLNFMKKKQPPQVDKITIPFLKAQGISKIDGIFVSHQDADHVGDLKALMSEIKVDKLYMGKGLIKNPAFKRRVILSKEKTQFIEVLAGDVVNEKIDFNILHPFISGSGKNEDSMAVYFTVNKHNWLFTGDLDKKGEEKLMSKYKIKADYFKLGHHGSKTASSKNFLEELNPKLVFISAGRKNRFNHPHQETLNTLKQLRIPAVSTQQCGMISYQYGMGQEKIVTFMKGK